ncbi:MAG: DUF5615 family PIN-like protein [Egibacteraceae bacterium]
MRLLLDEHYSPEIARQLRRRGHDAVSVVERPDLAGLADSDLLERMASEERVILTENAIDFVVLTHQLAVADMDHPGVLLTSPKRMPRSRATIGLFVRTLDAFLTRHPAKDACRNEVRWLSP